MKREVAVLASKLKRDRHEIAGRLMVLWEWCDDNFSDEDVVPDTSNVSLILGDKCPDFLDAIMGLPGMAKAMAAPDVGWLSFRTDGSVVFRNLARHNGNSAKSRAYERKKKQEQRGKRGNESDQMSPFLGDKTGTTEQKRIEEKKKEDGGDESQNDPLLEKEAADLATEFHFRIPGISKPTLQELTSEFQAKLSWLRAHGRSETKHIRECILDPKRDKTASNTINKMFKFWQFCGLEKEKSNERSRSQRSFGTAPGGGRRDSSVTAKLL